MKKPACELALFIVGGVLILAQLCPVVRQVVRILSRVCEIYNMNWIRGGCTKKVGKCGLLPNLPTPHLPPISIKVSIEFRLNIDLNIKLAKYSLTYFLCKLLHGRVEEVFGEETLHHPLHHRHQIGEALLQPSCSSTW